MSLNCEISGESLATTSEEIVVTPSGHTCIKRLLLTKLSENGGMDPFETIRELPLKEDQLITLKSKKIVPPKPAATSLPNLLTQMQAEYDALVLELFDTRKALEETRKELSQALYQNDAAVRVVSRLSVERDQARQALEQWNASATAAGSSTVAPAAPATSEDEPATKKRKLEQELPLQNDLPEDDLKAMVDTWSKIQPQRKPMLKAAAAKAPTPDQLDAFTKAKKSWHKTTCKGIVCMASSASKLATCGRDKQVIVFDTTSGQVEHSFNFGTIPCCVDILDDLVVAANSKGRLTVYNQGNTVGTLNLSAGVVTVQLHPTAQHVCATTSNGHIEIISIDSTKVEHVSTFSSSEEKYTCGSLHPDGLIYVAGTATGKIHMWDFKNKTLAGTMQDNDDDDTLTSMTFSNNGYHLATASSSSVKVWDLRKQKALATMTYEQLNSISQVAFEESGKYLAVAGKGGVQITTVKEWNSSKTLSSAEGNPVRGIVWGNEKIVTCNEKGRDVFFHAKE